MAVEGCLGWAAGGDYGVGDERAVAFQGPAAGEDEQFVELG
jgi:hypothetical protein